MKQFLPIITLLFICTCVNKSAAAQDSAAVKAKVDTTEEIEIGCSFPSLDAGFPGGEPSWQRYISRHLVYPKKAKRKKIEGTVTVQFILDKFGYVAEVEAISGPLELRQSAIRVIKKSPKWDPAIQGGRQVKAFKKYDIVFKLDSVSIKKSTYLNWIRISSRPVAFSYISNHDTRPAQYSQIHS